MSKLTRAAERTGDREGFCFLVCKGVYFLKKQREPGSSLNTSIPEEVETEAVPQCGIDPSFQVETFSSVADEKACYGLRRASLEFPGEKVSRGT